MKLEKLLQSCKRPNCRLIRYICVCVLRFLYVDRNSSSATLYLSRSGYSHKLVIVTYITQQLSRLSPATNNDDDFTVAGVRVYPAIEGVDFTGTVSTVALGIDVVSIIHDSTGLCLLAFKKVVVFSQSNVATCYSTLGGFA